MIFLNQALAILHKDLLAEWRTKERLSPMAFFVLLVLLVFNFSFELGGAAMHEIGPGVLWSSFVFASLLGLHRTFGEEYESGCIDGLMAAPGERSGLYLGKMLGNLVFLLVVELLTLPVFALFFNLTPGLFLTPLLVVFALGAASLAGVGTLFAALSCNMRLRELLLPLLLIPMVLPALISCIEATRLVLQRRPFLDLVPHLQILVVYVVVFVTLSLILFEFIIEE